MSEKFAGEEDGRWDAPVVPFSDEPGENWPDTDREHRVTYDSVGATVPLEDLQSRCVCDGKWVESPAAISTAVRWANIRNYHDEMWMLVTMADIDVLLDWRLRAMLSDGKLVRAEDLPDDVDIPRYRGPLNYRPSSDDRADRVDERDTDEEAP